MTTDILFQEQLILKFKPLIHKVLRSVYLNPSNPNYDDYYQELSLELINIVQNFKGDPLGDEQYIFTAYAQRGLKWFLIDKIRADKFPHFEISASDAIYYENEEGLEFNSSLTSGVNLFMTEAKKRLNAKESELFKYIASGDYTLTELAKHFGLSRKTISKRKGQIKEKLKNLKYILF